jgi:hypothetical protein
MTLADTGSNVCNPISLASELVVGEAAEVSQSVSR